MAVFRGFYRVIKAALFALVVSFVSYNAFADENSGANEEPGNNGSGVAPVQFVLYDSINMDNVLETFVSYNYLDDISIQNVIDGFNLYGTASQMIRCSVMDFDRLQQDVQNAGLDLNVSPQNNWNIYNTFSFGTDLADNCYDFVNQRVDCSRTIISEIVSEYLDSCDYHVGNNMCTHAYDGGISQCVEHANSDCEYAEHVVSCWTQDRPEYGFFMSLPIVTGGLGTIVRVDDNTEEITELLSTGPYVNSDYLTGIPNNPDLIFDGFLLSAVDVNGNYYPLRYISSSGNQNYSLFDNWYSILYGNDDPGTCSIASGTSGNHATYDIDTENTDYGCGNGYRQGSLSHLGGSSSSGTLGLSTNGTWGVDFKYDGSSAPMTRVKGQASCNTTIGIVNNANSSLSASVTDVSGPNCWCRSSQIGKVSGSTESNMTSAVSDWVFYGTIKNTNECTKQCAKNCATYMKGTQAFRAAIYGSI